MSSKDKLWLVAMKVSGYLWYCHQIPDRSFFIGKYQFPLCARCTGVLLGYIVAIVLLLLQVVMPIYLCIDFMLPLILDGSVQLLFCIMSNNGRRITTGFLFGIGLVQLLKNLIGLLFC